MLHPIYREGRNSKLMKKNEDSREEFVFNSKISFFENSKYKLITILLSLDKYFLDIIFFVYIEKVIFLMNYYC